MLTQYRCSLTLVALSLNYSRANYFSMRRRLKLASQDLKGFLGHNLGLKEKVNGMQVDSIQGEYSIFGESMLSVGQSSLQQKLNVEIHIFIDRIYFPMST